MNDELQPLLHLLSGKFGWLPTVVAWMGAVRLAVKWVSGWVQMRLTAMLAEASASPSASHIDRALIDEMLSRGSYRTMAFALDLFLSIKLPTHAAWMDEHNTKLTAPGGAEATLPQEAKTGSEQKVTKD